MRDSRHPFYDDKQKCKDLLESIPAKRRIRGDDKRMSSEAAREMGCHEVAHPDTEESMRYPNTKRADRTVYYHQAACVITHGNKEIVVSQSAMDQFTASHICGNDHCVNPEHIDWETLRENQKRIGCYGYVRDSDGNKYECEDCMKKHGGRRCLTSAHVNSVPNFD